MQKLEKVTEAQLKQLSPAEQEAFEKAVAEHGGDKVFLLEAEECGQRVICRKPTRAQYRQWRSNLSDPARRSSALETLLKGSLLYPDPKAFDAILEDLPALADTFGSALVDGTLGAEDASLKKA